MHHCGTGGVSRNEWLACVLIWGRVSQARLKASEVQPHIIRPVIVANIGLHAALSVYALFLQTQQIVV